MADRVDSMVISQLTKAERNVLSYLAAVPGLGSQALRLIISDCKKTETNLKKIYQKPGLLIKILNDRKIVEKLQKFKKEYNLSNWQAWLKERQISPIDFEHELYPPLLREIKYAPIILWSRGNLQTNWWRLPVAVVGSRNMSAYGSLATKKLVGELVDLGCTIVSGGMYGVDLAAHQEALANRGKTVVVLGHGFVKSYPDWISKKHDQVLMRGGVLLTPFSPLALPNKGTFVARNRVVAGIVKAVVVVEAAARSGTFSTVSAALDEGREVCTVPGPITNPYSLGIKYLINQGATVVTSGLDIVESFMQGNLAAAPTKKVPAQVLLPQLQPGERLVLKALLAQPLSFDQLAQLLVAKINSGQLAAQVSLLELKGLIIKFGQTYRVSDQVMI